MAHPSRRPTSNKQRDLWDDLPTAEELRFKSLEKKVESLKQELEVIKNPSKKKSHLDGFTTYEKITKVVGEILVMSILPVGSIQIGYGFFKGKHGFIFTAIVITLCLYVFFDLYDSLAKEHDWKWRRKKNVKI